MPAPLDFRRAVREVLGIELAGDVAQLGDRPVCRECGGPLVLVDATAWIRAYRDRLYVHARPRDYSRAPHRARPSRPSGHG